MSYIFFLVVSCCVTLRCSEPSRIETPPKQFSQPYSVKISPGIDSVLSTNHSFYGDSLFPEHANLIRFWIKQYHHNRCVPITYAKHMLRESFEGYKNLGDVNNDKKNDTIFILPPLDVCENGQSYYFTDTKLPRLETESVCCHPGNFFKGPDIDEDGICEVGFFYSSCASRYKSVHLFRLKDNQWEKIAASEFDLFTQNPSKVKFETLVRKLAKNKFQMRNFLDGNKYWETTLLQ
ncbi:hypothetical protein [Xanthocytophaga agilis]|uniref:hypothetical protein n=1 Tax=Xanthocytophaga agilis TaxID=3048010 RepID=UPI0028D8DCE4|nr:hypothetical protein [Xanthocytophaga agilis]